MTLRKDLFQKLLKGLKWVSLVFASIGVALVVATVWFSRDRVDARYIPGAGFAAEAFTELQDNPPLEDKKTALLAFDQLKRPYYKSNFHWIKRGNGTIISLRKFSHGVFFVVDDESFSQVSIFLPRLEEGVFTFDTPGIKGYFTQGASAWPEGQCGAPVRKGSVVVTKANEDSAQIRIAFQLDCTRKRNPRTEAIDFQESHTFRKLDFEMAGPWHGRQGKHIYSETYRTQY